MVFMNIYNSLNSKIKAMKSHLLTNEDYYNLSNIKTVEDVAVKLRDFEGYEKYLSDINVYELRRNLLERRIRISLYEDYFKIYNFVNNYELRKYLDGLFMRNEIHIIKLLLCIIYDDKNIYYSIPEVKDIFNNKNKFDIAKLINSKSVREFIENLRNTKYYNILERVYDENCSLFDLELQLDLFYYMNLYKIKNKYLRKKVDRNVMSSINGTEIDLRNIIWIYRLKTYYNLEKTLIYTQLIPIHYMLTNENINNLVESKSFEEFKHELEKTRYYNVFKNTGIAEKGFNEKMNLIYRKERAKYPNSISEVVSYIHFKEIEINNITTLFEGIRYSLAPNDILKYLTLPEDIEVK